MAAPTENLTRAEAARRAQLMSELHYDVHLDLDRGDETFGSRTVVTFEAAEAATTFIDCTAAEIERIVLNGEELDSARASETRIELPEVAAGRNELLVEASMAYQHEGKGLHFFRDPTDDRVYLHSQFEPFDAHLVFPCFDQPDLKASFDIAVDAPADWVVVSNTAAEDRPEDGDAGCWRFRTTERISTYLVAVVAGEYTSVHDRHGDVELGIYIRRSLAEHLDADELFQLTKQGLDWFAEVFELPYPFAKYDQLFVPEFSAGAMENPGCVTFSENYVFRSRVTDAAHERRAETLLHEMAHMWFGDLVTMRWWDDLWLNESFATFMSVLGLVSATRHTDAWVTFLASEKAWAKYQDQMPSTHPIAADMPDIESVHQNFDGITYAKGASVLRQLVAWVGQDEFLEGCRRYFRKHAWDNAELVDFLAALEDASGRDLGPWRDEWLRTTGVNTLHLSHRIDPNGRILDPVVEQTADDDPALRRHRVAIGVYDRDEDGALVRTSRVELDVEGERTEVPELAGVDGGELVLVNDDDLTYAKVRLDERTMQAVTDGLAALSEPLPRALVWSSTWDMVRDADLAARRFVAMVINNVASESQVGVLQRLLNRARAAALSYGDPANRDAVLADLAAHAESQARAAEPGGDAQLVWTRHWASVATDPGPLERIRGILDGDGVPEGLAVDTELRWHLVQELAAAGAVGEDVIDAELERDPTDLGERHAATARAARPDPAAKERAWEQLVEDPSLSHTMSRQLWSGFQQLDQEDVLAGYDRRYFDVLDRVWEERSLDWAIEFTEGMFPHALAGDQLLAQLDRQLARDDLRGPRRRALLEQGDLLRRTLRARDLDASAG